MDWLSAVPNWMFAFGASGALGWGAWRRGSLSTDGAIAAAWVGASIGMGLGLRGFIVLCVFFFTSTLLGRVGKVRKQRFETHYAKGHRRDVLQVLANGGVASACATWLWLGSRTAPEPSAVTPIAVAAYASLASANADTWATELGVLSRSQPWHLLQWRRVAAGTSGAISGLGSLVAWLGAATIAASAYVGHAGAGRVLAVAVAIVTGAGFLGALADSALGAVAQRQYVCRHCGEQVETKLHCDAPARVVGPRWAALDNDSVNLIANGLAAVLAWVAVTSGCVGI